MSTGMTWEQVQDELDWPAVEALTDYWKENPPVHVLVAAYMGAGQEEKPQSMTQEDIEALMAVTPMVQR